jgi:hypothetical protein
VDGRAQPEFALAFGARRSDLPTALILSAHHRRFAALRGAFSESTIDALVNGVLSGKVKTASIQVAPRPIAHPSRRLWAVTEATVALYNAHPPSKLASLFV